MQGSFIGVDVTGTGGLGNNQGVRIFNGSNKTIGGMTSTARNVVSGNSSDGIAITASDSFSANANVVQGNFVGTDVSGTVVRPNGGSGMVISVFSGSGTASNNTIGGTMAGAGNVISGNNVAGVSIVNGASGNTVQGNFLGTDVTGTLALGNRTDGVEIENSPNNVIGGAAPGARNIISGNDSGIYIGGISAAGNLVQGNFIGTDVTGTAPVGNVGDGIEFRNASGNTTGGTLAGAGNTIAFNGGDGVAVFSGKDNAILGNSIFSNGGLGIDLIPDGVTPNDSGDADAGANDLQNFPTLTSATNGSSTTVAGTLDSTPSRVPGSGVRGRGSG